MPINSMHIIFFTFRIDYMQLYGGLYGGFIIFSMRLVAQGFGYYINRDRLNVATGVYTGPGSQTLPPPP